MNKFFVLVVVGLWLLTIILLLNAWHLEQSLEATQSAAEELGKIAAQDYSEQERIKHLEQMAHTFLWEEKKENLWAEVMRHGAIAFFIASLLIIFVEVHVVNHTKNELREFTEKTEQQFANFTTRTATEIRNYAQVIAQNVWVGLADRLIPRGLSDEIESLIKSSVYMYNRNYTFIIGIPGYEGVPKGKIVVRRILDVKLKNMKLEDYLHTFTSRLQTPEENCEVSYNGVSISLPRHISLRVNGEDIDLKEQLEKDQRNLSHDILLPRDGEVEIYTAEDELWNLTDTQVYGTGLPSQNLSVRIANNSPLTEVVDVTFYHPREKTDFKHHQHGLWEFAGGILPGQSVVVSVREISTPKTPRIKDAHAPHLPPL